jgi:hypothetical protein
MYFTLFADKTIYPFCVIPGFRHEADVNCALTGHYAASGGNILPIGCPETPVRNFTATRCVITGKIQLSKHRVLVLCPHFSTAVTDDVRKLSVFCICTNSIAVLFQESYWMLHTDISMW